MHVTIEHLDHIKKYGFFRTKTIHGNFVKVLIELTQAESAILNHYNLWDYVLFEIPNPLFTDPFWRKLDAIPAHPDSWEGRHPSPPMEKTLKRTIKNFCSSEGFIRRFDTLGEAKHFALQARTYIQKIKDMIHENSTPPKTESFDL